MKRLLSSATPRTRQVDLLLIALALIGLGFHALNEGKKHVVNQPYYDQKLAAASRADSCFKVIYAKYKGKLDDRLDVRLSGLIGEEQNEITSDTGILEAKKASVNPNFAAVFVQWFHELSLQPGDPVAVGMTGSFPALNICFLAAAEEMGLHPIVITSVGASDYGANLPYFTWLDMERLLHEKGLLKSRSSAASVGGLGDRGRRMGRGRELLIAAIERNGIPLIYEPKVYGSVQRRIEIYDREAGSGGVHAYVNIGGGVASAGAKVDQDRLLPGVNRELPEERWKLPGALQHYGSAGIGFVQVRGIRDIADLFDFPTERIKTIPEVGSGQVFRKRLYNLGFTIPALIVYLGLCLAVLWARHRAARSVHRNVLASPAVPDAGREAVGKRSG